jgi:hypothetical protein
MTRKDNILQELSELNSTLATITPQNVYSVPAGYFDGLAAQVLNRIKAIEAANAVEELSYLSPVLSSFSKQMPFSVPQDYFEGLAEKAIQAVRESNDYLQKESFGQTAKEEMETLSPLLSGLNKEMPYSIPQGYFESLAENQLQSIDENNNNLSAKEELATLSPLLSGLKKEMPYSIPQGYFESLTENISKQENKPAAKVISLTSRKWFRYAAAAVVIGIISMTGFMLIGGEKEPGGKALAKLTSDVKKMNDTQKDKLIDFIDAGMSGDETAQISTDNKSDEVKNLLQGISADELKDFEEQTEDLGDVLMTN